MTKPLSPAARTVWNAYLDNTEWEVTQCELKAVAAALRALADQLAYGHKKSAIIDEDKVLAIADELEALPND